MKLRPKLLQSLGLVLIATVRPSRGDAPTRTRVREVCPLRSSSAVYALMPLVAACEGVYAMCFGGQEASRSRRIFRLTLLLLALNVDVAGVDSWPTSAWPSSSPRRRGFAPRHKKFGRRRGASPGFTVFGSEQRAAYGGQ